MSESKYRFVEKSMPAKEASFMDSMDRLATFGDLTPVERFMNFPVFCSRQTITRFLVRHELFRMVLEIPGSVFECGVLMGGGLFSFAHCSAIYEPFNAQRRIVGFDTFAGLPELCREDASKAESSKRCQGAMAIDSRELLNEAAALFDSNRPLNHLPRIELVKGDVCQTMPKYFEDNPHALVSLLYLDMDLYAGTKAALEACLPRMPKGAVIGFDEFACERWPGETLALLETLGVRGVQLRRFPFDSYVSYCVL